ncbi:hypothetical protein DFJ73DRAFT_924245 [Zopfochytrium polystomum]|nr:hypothetical protein DFJ73DRAFT_924245 [Zopfochytrium polystomum]
MSGKGKTPARPASAGSTAPLMGSSRPITAFFSPSPFAVLSNTDFPPLPPPSTPTATRSVTKRKSVDHPSPDQLNWAPSSSSEYEALELALFYAVRSTLQSPCCKAATTSPEKAGRRTKFTGHFRHSLAALPDLTGVEGARPATPPPPDPAMPPSAAAPLQPESRNLDQPPLQAVAAPPPHEDLHHFLDQIVRLNLDPNDDGYTRSLLDGVATAARITLAPIFLAMERIITDQDQLVASLRRQLAAAEAPASATATETAATAAATVAAPALAPTAGATPATLPTPVHPRTAEAAVNTDPVADPTHPVRPALAKGRRRRTGPEGSRKGDRMARPKYPSRQAKQAIELSLASGDTIPALVFRPLAPSRVREPVRYVPVYFRASITHPEARKNPLHWMRASLAAMKAPYAPELSPIGRGLRLWEAWVAEERAIPFTKFLSDHPDIFEHLSDFDPTAIPSFADYPDEAALVAASDRAAAAFLRRRSRLARNAFPLDLRRCIVEAFPDHLHERLEPGLARLLPPVEPMKE